MIKNKLSYLVSMFLLSSAHAWIPPQHGAVVTLSTPKTAYELMANANHHLINIQQRITQMRILSIQAINDANSDQDRNLLDTEYQADLASLDARLKTTESLVLHPQTNEDISIDLYDSTEKLHFSLKGIDAHALGIDSATLKISTREEAQIATNKVQAAIFKLSKRLPASTMPAALAPFKQTSESEQLDTTYDQLVFNHQSDRKKILSNLVRLRFGLYSKLRDMHYLAQQVISQEKTEQELAALNEEFSELKETYNDVMRQINLLSNTRLFNHNELIRITEKNTENYSFPKMSLGKFNLVGSNLINKTEARLSLSAVDNALTMMYELFEKNSV